MGAERATESCDAQLAARLGENTELREEVETCLSEKVEATLARGKCFRNKAEAEADLAKCSKQSTKRLNTFNMCQDDLSRCRARRDSLEKSRDTWRDWHNEIKR